MLSSTSTPVNAQQPPAVKADELVFMGDSVETKLIGGSSPEAVQKAAEILLRHQANKAEAKPPEKAVQAQITPLAEKLINAIEEAHQSIVAAKAIAAADAAKEAKVKPAPETSVTGVQIFPATQVSLSQAL